MSSFADKAKSIFLQTVEKHQPNEWSGHLDAACGEDRELRQRVEGLLQAHQERDSLFDQPDPTANIEQISEQVEETVGPYKLLQQVGEGGMGVVYLAERQHPVKQRVALKIIKHGLNSKNFVARFEVERQALAMMDHPNIAKVLDAGCTKEGRPYFVMELVKGISISEFCDQNRLTTHERLELFVQVCQAVQHAHQKGIIHRDIKPSNVLVALYDQKPVPKVIDFGVAKATNQQLTEKTLFTEVGSILGTWEYMSPEQAILNQLDVDTRIDVYSLGVLLYELLTGETPLDRKRLRAVQLMETLRMIREEEPPKPSTRLSSLGNRATAAATYRKTKPDSLASEVRGDLDWIVMTALAKERSRRYDSPARLSEDVERFLANEPIEARPPTLAYQTWKYFKRHKAIVSSVGVIFLCLTCGLVATGWYAVRATRAEREATLERKKAEERLGIVKDYTMLLARTGDSRDLQMAIKTSQAVGASDVWRIMLRAQSALDRGDTKDAVNLLREGLEHEEDPEHLSCKGLLGVALIIAGNTDQHLRIHRELTKADPKTAEQLIFVGSGLHMDSSTWWRMANQALELRDSPFARLNRAYAAINYSLDWDDLNAVRQGIQDMAMVENSIVETPNLMTCELQLYLAAMLLAGKESTQFDGWQKKAERIVKKLSEHEDYAYGMLVSAWYKDQFASLNDADKAWEVVLERGAGGWHDIHAAAMIARKGELGKWRGKLVGNDTLERTALATLLAMGNATQQKEALNIYASLKTNRRIVHFQSGAGFEIPLVAKELEMVRADAAALLGRNVDFLTRFDEITVKFLAGRLTPATYEKELKAFSRTDQLMGFFLMGLSALANDDKSNAIKYFRKTRATKVFHTSDY